MNDAAVRAADLLTTRTAKHREELGRSLNEYASIQRVIWIRGCSVLSTRPQREQITIAGHQAIGGTENSTFDDSIVVWVATDTQRAFERDEFDCGQYVVEESLTASAER